MIKPWDKIAWSLYRYEKKRADLHRELSLMLIECTNAACDALKVGQNLLPITSADKFLQSPEWAKWQSCLNKFTSWYKGVK